MLDYESIGSSIDKFGAREKKLKIRYEPRLPGGSWQLEHQYTQARLPDELELLSEYTKTKKVIKKMPSQAREITTSHQSRLYSRIASINLA